MKVWWMNDNKLGVGDYDNSNVTKLADGETVRIHFTKKDTDITNIPDDYHEGIIGRVIEKLAARSGDYQKAQYYANEWQNAVRQGKYEANRGKDGSAVDVLRYDY